MFCYFLWAIALAVFGDDCNKINYAESITVKKN